MDVCKSGSSSCLGFALLSFFGFSEIALASSLTVEIDSYTKSYSDPDQFSLAVTFTNTDDKSVVVFPAYLRRQYVSLEKGKARYHPSPGPVIDPWRTAIELKSGESKTVSFQEMQSGDGYWGLEHGRYKLRVQLLVGPNPYRSPHRDTPFEGVDIWIGEVESETVDIHFMEKPR